MLEFVSLAFESHPFASALGDIFLKALTLQGESSFRCFLTWPPPSVSHAVRPYSDPSTSARISTPQVDVGTKKYGYGRRQTMPLKTFIAKLKEPLEEDQDVAKAYRKPEMAETVLHGSSKNLISGGVVST